LDVIGEHPTIKRVSAFQARRSGVVRQLEGLSDGSRRRLWLLLAKLHAKHEVWSADRRDCAVGVERDRVLLPYPRARGQGKIHVVALSELSASIYSIKHVTAVGGKHALVCEFCLEGM
jgi:hypothetical protein